VKEEDGINEITKMKEKIRKRDELITKSNSRDQMTAPLRKDFPEFGRAIGGTD